MAHVGKKVALRDRGFLGLNPESFRLLDLVAQLVRNRRFVLKRGGEFIQHMVVLHRDRLGLAAWLDNHALAEVLIDSVGFHDLKQLIQFIGLAMLGDIQADTFLLFGYTQRQSQTDQTHQSVADSEGKQCDEQYTSALHP